MRRRRVRTALFAWATALCLAWAAAADPPEAVAERLTAADGDVIVTDARGVIVAVGRVVAGSSFELRVLEGFVGPARLTLLHPDGATEALDVVIDDRVMVEGVDLLELLDTWGQAYEIEVDGVAYHEAERRDDDAGPGAGAANGPGRTPVDPPGPPEAPGPPESPGGPASPGPRGPEGRP